MRRKSYINLTDEQQKELLNFIESDKRKRRERRRAVAILSNSQQKSVNEIANMLNVHTDAVYDWIKKYKSGGIEALKDKPIPGRPMSLKLEIKKEVEEILKK